MAERVDFVPRHEGDYVFPGDQLFTCLLHLAHLPGQPFAVRDVNAGIERTHAQLLSDVLNYREVIKTISALMFCGLSEIEKRSTSISSL